MRTRGIAPAASGALDESTNPLADNALTGNALTHNSLSASMSKGLTAFALVWQSAWIATDPALWPTGQVWWVSSLLIFGVLSTIPVLVLTTWGPWSSRFWGLRVRWVNVTLLSLAAFALLGVNQPDTSAEWEAGASLVNLAVATAGLFLPVRAAIPVVTTVIATEFVILLGRRGLGIEAPELMSDVLYAAYALALGGAAIGSRFALERFSSRVEGASKSIEEALIEVEWVRAETDRFLSDEIKIHETALNTLTAIGRGGISQDSDMRERIRERAHEAERLLESVTRVPEESRQAFNGAEVKDPNDEISQLIADAKFVGMKVRITGKFPVNFPPEVRAAMIAAIREAVSNAIRHSNATSVRIRILRGSWRDGAMRVRVVISDDGIGFDDAHIDRGFGTSQAIEGSLRIVGGLGTIVSAPGEGTRVELAWPVNSHRHPHADDLPIGAAQSVANPVLGAMWIFSGLSLVGTISFVASPILNLLAFVAYSVLVLIVIQRASRGFLTWPLAVFLCISAPFVFRLQDAALTDLSSGQWTEWTSEALVALLFVVAAIGPMWVWPVALLSWFVMQGDVLTEITQPGTAVIVAGSLLGFSLHRSLVEYQRRKSELIAAQRQVDATLADAERLAARYESVRVTGVLPLLHQLGEGEIDPSAPEVREACRIYERHIRSLMGLDPIEREFDRALISLSDLACSRGVLFDVVIPASLPDLGSSILTEQPGPFEFVAHMKRGSTARFSAYQDDSSVTLRCVGELEEADSMALDDGFAQHFVAVDENSRTRMWGVCVDSLGDSRRP